MPTLALGRRRIGWLHPSLPGRSMPVAETRRRTLTIRVIAVVALVDTFGYLLWRAGWTVDLSVWWLSVPLLVLEIHAFIGLTLFTFSLWDVDRQPPHRDVTAVAGRVAILVPTYNEDLEVLTPTIAAAVAMRIPHETWVLDDGDRPAVARLAAELGARYLARSTHEHAKAGNLNHALGIIDAEFIGVLDADHVASPDFLVRTLGYFDDPRIAVVQTPQEFYNVGSFEHEAGASGKLADLDPDGNQRFHEQALFYRVLQPGKNRWGGAFWCGTGAVVRVTALRDVGLVATDTITEDIHTTIRLHRRGWRTVYHNEVLARGLAASDAASYQLQRHRWGTGAMQVLRTENPLVVSGLSVGQRLSYAATLLGWFDAWRSLGYLILPMLVIATGAVPIKADALTFAIVFGTMFLLSQASLSALSRGYSRPVLSILFEFVRMTPNLLATTSLVTNRRAAFKVTPKGRTGDGRSPVRAPRLLVAMLGLSVATAAWYALTLLGVTPVVYAVPWAVHAAFAWMLINAGLLWLAIRRVRSPHYAAERRSSVRFATNLQGRLDGIEATVRDVSLTGARIELPASATIADRGRLIVDIPGESPLAFTGSTRSTWAANGGGTLVGFEFDDGQHVTRAHLALALFGASSARRSRGSAMVDPAPIGVEGLPVATPLPSAA